MVEAKFQGSNAAGRIQLHEQDSPLRGRRLLVVEDVSVIALELETILIDAGASEVVVAGGVSAGRNLVASNVRFDAAVIGVFLDVAAVELALAIAESGCPVVLVSAQQDGLMLTSPLDRARRIGKPYRASDVIEAVASALRSNASGAGIG